MNIVKVTWIDAQRLELGMPTIREAENIKPIFCDIVGFLVYEDKEKVVLAQENWDDVQQIKYVHAIPKRSE